MDVLHFCKLMENPNYIDNLSDYQVKKLTQYFNVNVLDLLNEDRYRDILEMHGRDILMDLMETEYRDEIYEYLRVDILNPSQVKDILIYIIQSSDYYTDEELDDCALNDILIKVFEECNPHDFANPLSLVSETNIEYISTLLDILQRQIKINQVCVRHRYFKNFKKNMNILVSLFWDLDFENHSYTLDRHGKQRPMYSDKYRWDVNTSPGSENKRINVHMKPRFDQIPTPMEVSNLRYGRF